MTQEEIKLLLKDLCGRIIYDTVLSVKGLGDVYLASINWWGEVGVKDYTNTLYPIDDVKPYLRPMSSMTEEEKQYKENYFKYDYLAWEYTDWLNKKMFDYRGLIPMGLALEAPEGMYKNE